MDKSHRGADADVAIGGSQPEEGPGVEAEVAHMNVFGDLDQMDASDPYEGRRVHGGEDDLGSLTETQGGRHGADQFLAERSVARFTRIRAARRLGGLILDD